MFFVFYNFDGVRLYKINENRHFVFDVRKDIANAFKWLFSWIAGAFTPCAAFVLSLCRFVKTLLHIFAFKHSAELPVITFHIFFFLIT